MKDTHKKKKQSQKEIGEFQKQIAELKTPANKLKKTEKAFQESERKYRTLVEQSLMGIMIVQGKQPRFRFVNNYAADVFGYTVDELLSLSLKETMALIHPDDLKKVYNHYRDRLSGKPVENMYQMRIIRKDGSIRWGELFGRLIEYNGQPAVLVSLVDITHRKRVEERGKAFANLGQLLSGASNPEEAARVIVNIADELLGWDGCYLVLYSEDTNTITPLLAMDIINGNRAEDTVTIRAGGPGSLIRRAIKEGKYLILRKDESEDIGSTPFGDTSRHSASLMFVPIRKVDKVVGVLSIQSYTPNKYTEEDLETLQSLADHCGGALERIQAQEALRENEERFRAIFESAQDSIFIKDKFLRYIKVNPAVEKLYGLPASKIIGLTDENIFGKETERYIKEIDSRVLKGEIVEVEYSKPICGISRMFNVAKVPVHNSSGEIIGLCGIARDITERKEAEEELKYVHQIYRDAIENAQGVTYSFKYVDGEYEFISEGCAQLLGIPPKELTFKKMKEIIKESVIRDTECPSDPLDYSKAFRDGELKRYQVDYKVITPQGEEKWISDCSLPIRDEETGKVIGALGILNDVTDRKKLEAQFLQSQKMEAIGRFAGGIAHDFNNLLTAMQGYADMAMMEVDEAEPLYRDLKQIRSAVVRAADLTRQLLLFSRKQPMEFVPININRVIEDLLKMLKRLIGEDVSIIMNLNPNLWCVRADKGNIEQVIMNMAVNSRDAMPEGGKIIIRTENVVLDGEDTHNLVESYPGKFVILSVADTGIGMSDEIIQHMFEPFFSTKEIGKGSGLGLSVVYGIVKQHEGWINVESYPGKGSTFRIYLPAFSPGLVLEETKEKFSIEEFKGNGEYILLVEDEENVREFAYKALTSNGYTVFKAANAKEALEIFEKEKDRFHLVFSDVVLPDKTGIQLIDDLGNYGPKLKVVLCSGYADQKSQWEIIHKRGLKYIQKPYSLITLLRVIKESLR